MLPEIRSLFLGVLLIGACSGETGDTLDEPRPDSSIGGDAASEHATDAAIGLDGALGDAGADGPDDADAATEPPRTQVYVNAETGSDSNAGTSDAPYQTLGRAYQAVGEHGLVWLQPSSFTNASEGLTDIDTYNGVSAPLDTLVRA